MLRPSFPAFLYIVLYNIRPRIYSKYSSTVVINVHTLPSSTWHYLAKLMHALWAQARTTRLCDILCAPWLSTVIDKNNVDLHGILCTEQMCTTTFVCSYRRTLLYNRGLLLGHPSQLVRCIEQYGIYLISRIAVSCVYQ